MKTIKNSNVVYYTVAELIKALAQFPQDMPVFVSGYEDGFENILTPKIEKLEHKPDNPYWDGEFQEIEEQQQSVENSLQAVVLRREVR